MPQKKLAKRPVKKERSISKSPSTGASTLPMAATYAIVILASFGVAVSAYLTVTHFTQNNAFCPSGSGCETVQLSRYSEILGIPVAIIGMLGFITVGIITALRPSSSKVRALLFVMAVAGFSFAAYLTYHELFTIKSICYYCVTTATLMTLILIVLLVSWPPIPQWRAWPIMGLMAATFIIVVGFSAAIQGVTGEASGPVPTPTPAATAVSKAAYTEGLAKHLNSIGAVMYGGFLCSHCADQKTMFGEYFRYIKYVECDPRGPGYNKELCESRGIEGYPTWEINGKLHMGFLELEELAKKSGYPAPDFASEQTPTSTQR